MHVGPEITSAANKKVKFVKRLQTDRAFRRQEGAFVVEGLRWLSELRERQANLLFVLASREWLEDETNRALVESLNAPTYLVQTRLLSIMSATSSPPGVLAATRMPSLPIPAKPSLALIVDGVANPGNLGAMVRSAAAASADALYLMPGTVDPYNPKAVRGSMGALLRIAIMELDWTDIHDRLPGVQVWLTSGQGGQPYWSIDMVQSSAIIVGSEPHGESPQAQKMSNGRVSIPLHHGVESLNAAVAASVLLFEAVRQRSRQS